MHLVSFFPSNIYKALPSNLSVIQSIFPNDVLQIDYFHQFGICKHSYKSILVIVDQYSNYCQAYPVKSEKAIEFIKILEEWISHYGIPRTIVMDRASLTKHHLFNSWKKQNNIDVHLVDPAVHRANAQAERKGGLIKTTIKQRWHDVRNGNDDIIRQIIPYYIDKQETTI